MAVFQLQVKRLCAGTPSFLSDTDDPLGEAAMQPRTSGTACTHSPPPSQVIGCARLPVICA